MGSEGDWVMEVRRGRSALAVVVDTVGQAFVRFLRQALHT